jgi:hypothetical protein
MGRCCSITSAKQHPDEIGLYLERMRTEDNGTMAAEAYGVVGGEEMSSIVPITKRSRSTL